MRPHIFMYQGMWCVQPSLSPLVCAWEDVEDAFEYARQCWEEAKGVRSMVMTGWPAQVH